MHPVQVFKEAFRAWQRNAGVFLAIYFAIFPLSLALGIALSYLPLITSSRGATALIGVSVFVVNFLIASWGSAALTIAGYRLISGSSCKASEAIVAVRGYFWRYLGAVILTSLILFGGVALFTALAFLIGGLIAAINQGAGIVVGIIVAIAGICVYVYFLIRLALVSTITITEKSGPLVSIRKSVAMIRDHINPVVGVFALLVLLVVALSIPAVAIWFIAGPDAIALNNLSNIYQLFFGAVFNPLLACLLVKMYFSLKAIIEEKDVHA